MSETARQGNNLAPAARGQGPSESLHVYAAVTATPWPTVKLGIGVQAGAVTSIDFLPEYVEDREGANDLAIETVRQLRNYFRDPRRGFNLPLAPHGTPFQQRIWRALRRIPAGATSSYGALARRLDSGARAIGGACRANPIPIIIPCHRVVAARGMGGFMGDTEGRALRIKQYLLDHESPS